MKASILLAIKREQRNRRSTWFRDGLHSKQAIKSVSDAVITHVTQVTVEGERYGSAWLFQNLEIP